MKHMQNKSKPKISSNHNIDFMANEKFVKQQFLPKTYLWELLLEDLPFSSSSLLLSSDWLTGMYFWPLLTFTDEGLAFWWMAMYLQSINRSIALTLRKATASMIKVPSRIPAFMKAKGRPRTPPPMKEMKMLATMPAISLFQPCSHMFSGVWISITDFLCCLSFWRQSLRDPSSQCVSLLL